MSLLELTKGEHITEENTCTLGQKLYQLQQHRQLCDMMIVTSTECVPVHKLVLIARCQYFEQVVQSQHSEGIQDCIILMKNQDHENVLSMIKFLYTGELYVSPGNVNTLHDLSLTLGISDAIAICDLYISKQKSATTSVLNENLISDICTKNEHDVLGINDLTIPQNTTETGFISISDEKHGFKNEEEFEIQQNIYDDDDIQSDNEVLSPENISNENDNLSESRQNFFCDQNFNERGDNHLIHDQNFDSFKVKTEYDSNTESNDLSESNHKEEYVPVTKNNYDNEHNLPVNYDIKTKRSKKNSKRTHTETCIGLEEIMNNKQQSHKKQSKTVKQLPVKMKKEDLKLKPATQNKSRKKTEKNQEATSTLSSVMLIQPKVESEQEILDHEHSDGQDVEKSTGSMKESNDHDNKSQEQEQPLCEKCGKSFETMRKLQKHRTIHRDEKFICRQCGKSLSSPYTLKAHIVAVHSDDSSKYKHLCHLCPKKFLDNRNLKNHLLRQHGIMPSGKTKIRSDLSSDRTNLFGRVYRKGTALSSDFRQLVIDDLIKNEANTVTGEIPRGICPELSRKYEVSKNCIRSVWTKFCADGKLEPRPKKGVGAGRQRKLKDDDLIFIESILKEKPSTSYSEIADKLEQYSATGRVSKQCLSYSIRNYLPSAKFTLKE